MKVHRGRGASVVLTLLLTLGVGESPASSPEEDSVLRSVEDLATLPLAEMWPRVEELKKASATLDTEKLEPLVDALPALDDQAMLVASTLLLDRGEPELNEKGQIALQRLARNSHDRDLRLSAIRLLREPVASMWREAYIVLQGLADGDEDPLIRVESSLSLWTLDNYPATLKSLKRLLDSPDASTRYEAALALAETGYSESLVVEILESFRKEPTERGTRAALLLRLLKSGREGIGRTARSPGPGPSEIPRPPRNGTTNPSASDPTTRGGWDDAIAGVARVILESSLRAKELTLRDLYVAALKGMVRSVDEYSDFLDPDETVHLEALQTGARWGLGAHIVRPDPRSPLLVVETYRGGPATLSGLRSGDRILEINGVPTGGTPLDDVRRLVAGKAATKVHLFVVPWNDPMPCMISIERGEVEIPSVRGELLPEGLGYASILRFGPGTSLELRKLLADFEERGLNAVLLDLRDNPGGKLEEAVKTVDLFVGERIEPIVSERGAQGTREWFSSPDVLPQHPLFVLVDENTASSAEVVAGALQDYQRAVVVGQTTYGKGVKQSSLPLSRPLPDLLDGEGRLLLTTSRLYLPLGRPISSAPTSDPTPRPASVDGIVPDLRVGETEQRDDARRATERYRVQYSPQVSRFILDHYSKIKRLRQERSPWNPTDEPEFSEVVASLETDLGQSQVARAIREAALRHIAEEEGGATLNFHDDPTLARAILESLRRLGRDPQEVSAYRWLPERFGSTAAPPSAETPPAETPP